MSRRSAVGLVVLLLAAVGFTMAAVPSLALEIGTLAIAVVGVVTLLAGYERYQRVKRVERVQTAVGDVEDRPPVVTPGDRLDRRRDEYRIEALAAAVIAYHHGCSRQEALDLLETGEWTDDEVAAYYFDETGRTPPRRALRWMPVVGRVPDRLTQRDRAVHRLAELIGIEAGER